MNQFLTKNKPLVVGVLLILVGLLYAGGWSVAIGVLLLFIWAID